LQIANAPATIDVDYSGNVGVILTNIGRNPVSLNKGDRIAQMVFSVVTFPDMKLEGYEAPEKEKKSSPRGKKGFGSTGV